MVQRSFKLGGVKGKRSKERVEDTLNLIDGVRQATLNEQAGELSIDFDSNVVHQDHLTSTLNSLGYSILGDRKDLYEEETANQATNQGKTGNVDDQITKEDISLGLIP